MVMIAIGSTLVGAVFGLRFSVLSVFAIYFAFAVATATAFLIGAVSDEAAVLGLIVHVITAQLGFIGGLFVRHFLAVSRLPASAWDTRETPAQKPRGLAFPADS